MLPRKTHPLHRTFVLCLLTAALSLASPAAPARKPTPVDSYRIVAKYPHSTENYTEGFFFKDGLFYEGTGLEGHSALLVETPETGKVLQRKDLDKQYFGEGIVDWGPNLYEWTWQSHIAFVYDRFSLRPVRQFTYGGEGWGMTHNQKELITSEGSATLRFRNPDTFEETHQIIVRDGAQVIDQLNELEWIHNEIWANVWHQDRIARISPADGHVIAWIDLKGLLPDREKINGESVLNGIAWDPAKDRIFVTGKQWPWVFEIQVVPKHAAKP